MKRIWAFSILLLTIISFTFASVKVSAAEIGKEYVYKSEEGIVYITLIDETNAKIYSEIYEIGLKTEMTGIYKISQEVENAIDFYAVSEINGEIIYDYWNTFILNEDGTAKEYVEVDNTQEETDKVPTIIEEKAKEFTDWIITLVVSFLGSSAFYLIVKAILKKTINTLKDKVTALTENKNISEESKKAYENKINELENTINKLIENNDKLLNYVREKLEVDAEKEKKMAELLDTLLVEEGVKND